MVTVDRRLRKVGRVSAPTSERRGRVDRFIPLAVLLLSVAVVVVLGGALHASQVSSQRQLAERFQARGDLASSFAATWVAQLTAQEASAAVDWLSGTEHLDTSLATTADLFDFRAAVVLNSHGVALAAYPQVAASQDAAVPAEHRHLSSALRGQTVVTSVVESASRGVPVVEFAVPYYTPDGRRVFSGAYDLRRLPLDAFLAAVTPIPHARVYLVDATGTVVGTDHVAGDRTSLGRLPYRLAAAREHTPNGDYTDTSHQRHYFTSHPVEGTPWSLIVTAPHETLFAPLRGRGHELPWVVLGLVALFASAANILFLRLVRHRDRLHNLNAALDGAARTDQLTSLPNRRHLDEVLAAALSAGGRPGGAVSGLVIDLDHFKRVNDTFGHTTGDRVLEHVAEVLREAVRTEDTIGRWGGEEFLAVLPHTDELGAARIADRIRQIVRDTPYNNRAGDRSITITLSIGCATSLAGGKDELIHRADQALYGAKAAGRDGVLSASSALPAR
jgi:diguanylate cyclase (GGDEF)-like protein